MKSILKSVFVQVGLKYGGIGSVFSILMFFVFVLMDKIPMISVRIFDFFLIPAFVFLTVKEFKTYRNNGELRFWQGMTLGFFTSFFLGLFYAGFLYVYLSTIGSTIFDSFVSFELDKIVQSERMIIEQMGKATYDNLLASMQSTEVYHVALDDMIKKLLVALFISPIISIFMRNSINR